jgi:hypothetical protein
MCAEAREMGMTKDETGAVLGQLTTYDLVGDYEGDHFMVPTEDGKVGEWVLAEDAIKREAELLARIQDLEERAALAAEMVAKAADLMQAKADMIDPRQTIHLASGYRLDAIGAMKGVDLARQGIEPDVDYRVRLMVRLWEWRGPVSDGANGPV